MSTFSLITEPWIPVRVGEKLELYSLEQTLTRAQEIERVEDASPLVVVALHRFLLAVLYRALQGPDSFEELREWFEDGFPETAITDYLERWKHRFNLFDEERPFYQIADLDKAVFGKPIEPKAWTELAPEVRDGGQGASLFNHTNDVAEPIPAAEAFRHLLVRQTFALGGLSRTFVTAATNAPSPNAVFFIPHGRNLLETLCYCLDPNNYAHYEHDVPFWERDTVYDVAYLEKTKEDAVMGCVQAYTWMSRAVKLEPLEMDDDVYVQNIYFASGLAPKFEVAQYSDPMVGRYMIKSGANKDNLTFIRLNSDKQFWRDFQSLFAEQQTGVAPRVIGISVRLASAFSRDVNLAVYGISNKQAKINFARQESYVLPEAIIDDRTEDVYVVLADSLARADKLGYSLRKAVFEIYTYLDPELRIKDEKKLDKFWRKVNAPPPPKENPTITRLRITVNTSAGIAFYWSNLGRSFPNLLAWLTADFKPSDAERFWAQELLNASDRAWELARTAAGDDAFALRAVYSAEGGLRAAQKPFRKQVKEAA